MSSIHINTLHSGLTYGLQPSFTGTTNTYTAMRAEAIVSTPGINMIPVGYQKSENMRGPDADIVGGKSGTLAFNIPVRAGAGSGSPFMALAKYCGATLYSITNATAHITGGTSTTFTISTANATAHSITTACIGAAVFHAPVSGTGSIRFITRVSITSNVVTVTVNQAFAAVPANGDSLRGIDTIVPCEGEPSKYLTWRHYMGQGATDCLLWTHSACAGTWKLGSTDAGAIPMASFEYQVDSWTNAATAPVTAVLAADSFAAAKPVLGDALYIEGTQTDVKSIEFDPGIKFVPLASTYGTNGRVGWEYVSSDPVVNFTPYHDADLVDAWEAATQKTIMFESISNTSLGWALYLPETQLTAYALNDDEGIYRAGLTLKAIDPGRNADSKTYPKWSFAVSR